MLCWNRDIRTVVSGFASRSLITLAVTALVCWPSAGLAFEVTEISPQIILLIDESGSMSGRQKWLNDFLPALGQGLTERNGYDLPVDIEFTVAGFAEDSRDLVVQASEIDATAAIDRLSTDRGGTEDGYVAIVELLEGHPNSFEPPTTVILITDEDRDVTDADISLVNLAEYLAMKSIVVHAIIPAEILCPGRIRAIAVDQNRVALQPDVFALLACEDADDWTHRDYAELAWVTGGLTWDLGIFAPGWRRQASVDVREQVIAGLSDRILMQWPALPSAHVEFSPATPRPGDVVLIDGSKSIASQSDREVSNWAWDLDGDGSADEYGPIISRIFSTGEHRIVLEVTDNSTPPVTGRKVIHLEVAD